jgi:hypothetical protein
MSELKEIIEKHVMNTHTSSAFHPHKRLFKALESTVSQQEHRKQESSFQFKEKRDRETYNSKGKREEGKKMNVR